MVIMDHKINKSFIIDINFANMISQNHAPHRHNVLLKGFIGFVFLLSIMRCKNEDRKAEGGIIKGKDGNYLSMFHGLPNQDSSGAFFDSAGRLTTYIVFVKDTVTSFNFSSDLALFSITKVNRRLEGPKTMIFFDTLLKPKAYQYRQKKNQNYPNFQESYYQNGNVKQQVWQSTPAGYDSLYDVYDSIKSEGYVRQLSKRLGSTN